MRNFKLISFLMLSALFVFPSCENASMEPTDNLDEFGILGQWKLESISRNGISDLAVQCCDYIDFQADDELTDLKGNFTATGSGYESIGTFELNTTDNLIHFDYDNTQKSYEYQITDNATTFTYMEDNQEIKEYWTKEE